MGRLLLIIFVLLGGCKDIALEMQQDSGLVAGRFDPWQLKLALGAKGAYVEARFPESNHIVPKIDIDLMANDGLGKINYYEVQRCIADRPLLNSVNEDPTQVAYSSDHMAQKDHLYVWGKATAETCTFLHGRHTSSPFIDLTARTGSFFYILRPCLSAGRSVYGGKRTCSYKFIKTSVVEYKDELEAVERRTLSILSDYRFELQFLFSHMADTIREKARYLLKCQFNKAHDSTAQRRMAGIIKVSLTATAVVTAAIISGPQNAFIAGSTAARLGDKLFSGYSNASLNSECSVANYDRDIRDTQERVEQVVKNIGYIRQSLGEIKMAEEEIAPPPLPALEKAMTEAEGFETGGL